MKDMVMVALCQLVTLPCQGTPQLGAESLQKKLAVSVENKLANVYRKNLN